MGSPRSPRPGLRAAQRCPRAARAGLGLGLLGLLASGCHIAGANVWNLEQVHQLDGTPKRSGRVKGDMAYLLSQVFRRSNFGGADFQAEQAKEKRIEDPLGVCFENVIELARCQPDEKVAALQAEAWAWLAVDCTYVLSRERCTLELGGLAQRLELPAHPLPNAAPENATPELVKECFDELVETLRKAVAAPALAGDTLAQSCARVRGLTLDRAGALRLLRGTNTLLESDERGPLFAPLRELRVELARRCTALALREARKDPEGRVRAAALESGLRAFPEERAELLRWALVEPMEEVNERTLVSERALVSLAAYGLPPTPADQSEANFRQVWADLLVQVLSLQLDGPHSIAACRALAKITGEPATLRPEVWVARGRAWQRPEPDGSKADDPTGTSP